MLLPAPAGGAAVGQDLMHGVAPGDPGDAAAAVRGGPGLVQAADRGAEVRVAGGGAGVEHLARLNSPWKMLPPTSPYSCCIRCGPMTCRCSTESVNPGATASIRAITRSAKAASAASSGLSA